MNCKQIMIRPIGIIHTPHKDTGNMPIQPIAAKKCKGWIELFPDFVEGLTDLEEFSDIILIYHLHKIRGYELLVKPFMDRIEHGIFATRSPKRPNALGISTVKLLNIDGNILHIEMVDMLDATPLIDIKPFFPKFDNRLEAKSGWLDNKQELSANKLFSDDRFRS